MSIIKRILGSPDEAASEPSVPPCPHTSLVPHWDRAEDMGRERLARYVCTACDSTFTYEETRRLLNEPLPPERIEAEAQELAAGDD